MFDSCANGQQLKCLTVVDEFTHECLAIDVAGSIRSTRVIDVLTRLMSVHGAPVYLRSDNGPEFVSNAILNWLADAQIETAHIDPGKPWQNGTNESFNGKFRDECLSVEWFRTRREAQVIIEAWRRHFNAVRPHSSLAYLTPQEFKQHHPPIHDLLNRAISQKRLARESGLRSPGTCGLTVRVTEPLFRRQIIALRVPPRVQRRVDRTSYVPLTVRNQYPLVAPSPARGSAARSASRRPPRCSYFSMDCSCVSPIGPTHPQSLQTMA